MSFEIKVTGHPNLLALHRNTWEITMDSHLTKRGDCIIGVNASYAARDLPISMKEHLLDGGEVYVLILKDDEEINLGKFCGNEDLILTHSHDIVVRRSTFIDDRTIGIQSNMTARDIPREFIQRSQSIEEKYTIKFVF